MLDKRTVQMMVSAGGFGIGAVHFGSPAYADTIRARNFDNVENSAERRGQRVLQFAFRLKPAWRGINRSIFGDSRPKLLGRR